MEISYKKDVLPNVEDIISLYVSSGINRPVADKQRIQDMYANSNFIVTAWNKEKLVGISRSLTDFVYCCYLSDLAVAREYQTQGIGKRLIEITKQTIGDRCMLLLLAAPTAMDYYPKVGFDKVENGYVIKRKK